MKRWPWVLFVAALVLYLLTGVVQVRPGERAVVRRLGRVLADKPGPGLWIGLPWGIDRVDRVEVDAVRSVAVGYEGDPGDGSTMPAGQLVTGDNNLVNVEASLYYKVSPDGLADFALQRERIPGLLERVAEAVAGEWVAGQPVDEVLLRGKTALRAELLAKVRQRIAGYGLGVEVLDATVAVIAPPDEVREAFNSVAQAQTEMATGRNRAEQKAATRLLSARAEAFRIGESARGEAEARVILAKREAGRFLARLAQYRIGVKSDPDYLTQLWRDERGKLLGKLKERGQVDLLDHRLSAGGLEIIAAPGK